MMSVLRPLKYRMASHARTFASNFAGQFELDEAHAIDVAGKPTPTLRSGGEVLNLNFAIPDQFTAGSKVGATVFVRSGNDFIRITTSLRKQDGERAIGTILDYSHPAYARMLEGQSYIGYATIFGRQYMTQYDPIRNASGKVVGILFVGLDVSEMGGLGNAGRIALSVATAYGANCIAFRYLVGNRMDQELVPWFAGFSLLSAILIATFIYLLIYRSVNLTMADGTRAAQRVAVGDLTAQVHVDRRDDIGQMLHAINGIGVGLAGLVGNVRSATDVINQGAISIADGNANLTESASRQAQALSTTASTIHQITAAVSQNAEKAQEVNKLIVKMSDLAVNGGDMVSAVFDTMSSIVASARRIEDIISIIDGIAFQTNILALNAAVEAARAGEQGRGFAVVAAEVRNLALRSSTASKEIGDLIRESVTTAATGEQQVNKARDRMYEITDSILHVVNFMDEIAHATREQSQGIEEINRAISEIDDMTQQNAVLIDQATDDISRMRDQSSSLSQAVNIFKLPGAQKTSVVQPKMPS